MVFPSQEAGAFQGRGLGSPSSDSAIRERRERHPTGPIAKVTAARATAMNNRFPIMLIHLRK